MRWRTLRALPLVPFLVASLAVDVPAARTTRRIQRHDLRARVSDANGWMPDVAARLDDLRHRNGDATAEALARRGTAAATRQARGHVPAGAGR